MQHSGIRQFSKTILTAVGIVLLIVFGTRAASQARSIAAVGGEAKRTSYPIVNLNGSQLATISPDSLAGVRAQHETPVPNPTEQVSAQPAPVSQIVVTEKGHNPRIKEVTAGVQKQVAKMTKVTDEQIQSNATQAIAQAPTDKLETKISD